MARENCSRRAVLQHSGMLALASVAGCVADRSSGVTTVEMTGFEFTPSMVTIDVGETVRWQNTSDVDHTVTAYETTLPTNAAFFTSGGFDSERKARINAKQALVAPEETYEHTFDEPGTYDYYCIPHESSGMAGRIRVK